jgi:(2Fe-2S) ferredoxin
MTKLAGIAEHSRYTYINMPKFEKHIFVCTNQRPSENPRGSCDRTGGADLHQAFKAGLAKRGLKGKVRANKAGCLDQCEHGPTVVIYPQAVWYGKVTVADVDEIIDQHIASDIVVERLVIPDGCLNVESCPHKPRR